MLCVLLKVASGTDEIPVGLDGWQAASVRDKSIRAVRRFMISFRSASRRDPDVPPTITPPPGGPGKKPPEPED
jgi:hypothetical protein